MPRSYPTRALAPLLLAPVLFAPPLLALGCGDDGGDGGGSDAGTDAGPLMSTLFGPCNTNVDCVEYVEGGPALCLPPRLGFAEGACSRRCSVTGCRQELAGGMTRQHECLDSNGDILSFARTARGIGSNCYELCLNSNACAAGHTCIENACIPWSCAPGGVCGGDAVCGPSGICTDPDDVRTDGLENGASCGGDTQCMSNICLQVGFGASQTTRRCTANCLLPFPGYNDIEFYSPDEGEPMELPTGTCQGDTVCVPINMTAGFVMNSNDPYIFAGGNLGDQDPGRCVKACRSDADCAANELCANDIQTGTGAGAPIRTYDRSFCVIDPLAN